MASKKSLYKISNDWGVRHVVATSLEKAIEKWQSSIIVLRKKDCRNPITRKEIGEPDSTEIVCYSDQLVV